MDPGDLKVAIWDAYPEMLTDTDVTAVDLRITEDLPDGEQIAATDQELLVIGTVRDYLVIGVRALRATATSFVLLLALNPGSAVGNNSLAVVPDQESLHRIVQQYNTGQYWHGHSERLNVDRRKYYVIPSDYVIDPNSYQPATADPESIHRHLVETGCHLLPESGFRLGGDYR